MSYEGDEEYICKQGHYQCFDCYADQPTVCFCGAEIEWHHSIDCTNGYEEGCDATYPAATELIEREEVPHIDCRGNTYYSQSDKVRPAPGSAWKPYIRAASISMSS